MMRLRRFLRDGISLCACVHRVYPSPSKPAPQQGAPCQVGRAQASVGWWDAGRQEALCCRSEPRGVNGQIWPVLSIMSRWKGLYQITNLELITKVVAGFCFIPSPTRLTPLWGDWCHHLSVFLMGALPVLQSTTQDALLILFHLITP